MTLADYLVTRTVELVVHTDDLNAAVPGLDVPYDRQALAACTRLLADALAVKAPGGSTEVRIPPYAVVQCVEGPRHTRGTPPNVVETDPLTWIRLATGRTDWKEARRSGEGQRERGAGGPERAAADHGVRRPGESGSAPGESRREPVPRPSRPTPMDKQRFTLAVLTIVPLVVACGSEKANSGSGSVDVQRPVTGVDWQVRGITTDGSARQVHGAPRLTFDAKTGKVGGRLGCNAVNATATVATDTSPWAARPPPE